MTSARRVLNISLDDETSTEAIALADEIGELLRGRGREIQGAVITLQLARWLAGHFDTEHKRSDDVRTHALGEIIARTLPLVPIFEEELLDHTKKHSN